MSLLDASDQKITVTVYYKEVKSKGIRKIKVIDDNKAEELLLKDPKNEQIKQLVTYWRGISWKDDTTMIKEATSLSSMSGMSEFDPFRYRDLKLKRCLTDWDLKDDNGKKIPFNIQLVDKMPADIVHALLNKYEKTVSLDDEEEKK
jgi:hypothetical protein